MLYTISLHIAASAGASYVRYFKSSSQHGDQHQPHTRGICIYQCHITDPSINYYCVIWPIQIDVKKSDLSLLEERRWFKEGSGDELCRNISEL